jgi:aryl-alcohol dehydrogenase-like predicted oxidoreductase
MKAGNAWEVSNASNIAEIDINQKNFSSHSLAQGILTGKYKPGQAVPFSSRAANEEINQWINSYLNDDVLFCVQQLEDIAAGYGLKLSQLALAWVLRQPGVSSAIIGASRPKETKAYPL